MEIRNMSERFKEAIKSLESGEEKTKEEIISLLQEAYWLCNDYRSMKLSREYLCQVLRNQANLYKQILGEE